LEEITGLKWGKHRLYTPGLGWGKGSVTKVSKRWVQRVLCWGAMEAGGGKGVEVREPFRSGEGGETTGEGKWKKGRCQTKRRLRILTGIKISTEGGVGRKGRGGFEGGRKTVEGI